MVLGKIVSFLAALLMAGCTAMPVSVTPAESFGVEQRGSTISPSTPVGPAADLKALKIQTVSGQAPTKMPSWVPVGNIEAFTLDTLRFIAAGGESMGLDLSTLRFAIYDGSGTAVIDCGEDIPGYSPQIARLSSVAKWCPAIDALLVNAAPMRDPHNGGFFYQEVDYHITLAAGATLAKNHNSMMTACKTGLLFRGLVRQDPTLFAGIRVHLDSNSTVPFDTQLVKAFVDGKC